MKKIYRDPKESPLPIQIDGSSNLYFLNKNKKLLKINIENIAETFFESGKMVGEIEKQSHKDSWEGDSILLADIGLISKTGETRKSIPYGIELMLHHHITPVIDRYGYIRDLYSEKDAKTLSCIRDLIAEKNLDPNSRTCNINTLDKNHSKTTLKEQQLEVLEIEEDNEALWAEFERLRAKQKQDMGKNINNIDIWSRSHADKYDKGK
ncbi:MAG: hypothetical protein HKP55_01110 [Gammaproteobacteria bacterium]|nr:hypothetical protein [Gammaproteobacteria bacterium]